MSVREMESRPSGRLRRTRAAVVLMLVILTSLGVVVSLVGGWVRTTLFDTDAFMAVVEPSLASEEVVVVLSDAVSDQVVMALDLEARLEMRLAAVDAYLAETLVDALDLPTATKALLARSDLPRLANLAGAIAGPIDERIEDSVYGLMSSDAFQEGLPDVVAFAHRGAVSLIREDGADLANVSLADGEVLWDITPTIELAIGHVIEAGILEGVIEPIQLPGATYEGRQEDAVAKLGESLGTVLPEGFGQITVMSEERLSGWQSIARSMDRAALLAIVVTIVLAGLAIWVSRNRRRTVVQLAAGSVIALVVTGIVQRNVLAALDEAIPGPPEQAAAEVLFDAVFANLRAISWIFMAAAVAVGLSAHIAGRPKWITSLRGSSDGDGVWHRLEASMTQHRDAYVVGGVAIALLAWWWLGVNALSLVIVGVILGAYLWYLTWVAPREDTG